MVFCLYFFIFSIFNSFHLNCLMIDVFQKPPWNPGLQTIFYGLDIYISNIYLIIIIILYYYILSETSKVVDKFTYLGSSVSSTEKDIDTWLTKAWTAIDRLLIISKSDLTNKMKCSFFQAAVISILLYGCTTWTLTKQLKKKLDSNYTRMLRAILNKSWRQHPTSHQ